MALAALLLCVACSPRAEAETAQGSGESPQDARVIGEKKSGNRAARQAKRQRKPPVADVEQRADRAGSQRGIASYYGVRERLAASTATGEHFDAEALTAASRTLPLGSFARVTNLSNGRSVDVRINDRGPWNRRMVMDLTVGAARQLDMIRMGVAEVMIQPLDETAHR